MVNVSGAGWENSVPGIFSFKDASKILAQVCSISTSSSNGSTGSNDRSRAVRLWLHEVECELETKIRLGGGGGDSSAYLSYQKQVISIYHRFLNNEKDDKEDKEE